MVNPLTFIKDHPYGVAIAVFVVGVIYLLSRGGSDQGAATIIGPAPSSVQAGNDLAIAQLQANQASNDTNAQAAVASQNIAANVQVATLNAQVSDNNNTLQANTAVALASLDAATTQAVSTLQATVANNQTQAQVEAAANAIAGQVSIADLPYHLQEVTSNNTTAVALATAGNSLNIVQNLIASFSNIPQSAILHTGEDPNTLFKTNPKSGISENLTRDVKYTEGYNFKAGTTFDDFVIGTNGFTSHPQAGTDYNAKITTLGGTVQAFH